MQVGLISSFIKTIFIVMAIHWLTFFSVLPRMCKDLAYSMYYTPQSNPYDRLKEQNDERAQQARNFFESHSEIYNGGSPESSITRNPRLEFSLIVVTVRRNQNPHYLMQVVARLLPQVQCDQNRSRLLILNVDKQPSLNEDAVYLSKYVPVISRELLNDNEISHGPLEGVVNSQAAQDRFEKEKKDYVMALEVGLQTGSQHVVIIEDDAIPVWNLLFKLRIILGYKMPWRWLQSNSDVAFLKLFYPEKWQGFGFPEVPELICVGILAGTVSLFLHKKLQKLKNRLLLTILFINWALYCVLVVYAIGRQHLIEMRKISPFLHTVIRAPGCCTPAVLYDRVHARLLVEFLKKAQCSVKYPLDFALDDFSNKLKHSRYLVTPNLFTHIGVYSSLHSQPKHFREFDLLFEA